MNAFHEACYKKNKYYAVAAAAFGWFDRAWVVMRSCFSCYYKHLGYACDATDESICHRTDMYLLLRQIVQMGEGARFNLVLGVSQYRSN